ncbi:F0F1 ATP synthase subunit delta [Bartonella tamiae]|uniref:ATP synthase subunit delta n=1 Tax=Bartonella tamiae Th239 TaxID=1094558 RepID=J0QZD0_9HYPH|nr:F0F1 ATP synthase subunit delta [Bartonella tamiae]EJF91486.1 ATP synthase F1, delta subunit [Bartonella tamiae Th239]EJF92530.1 ATP synthase F1, delta subunit [Bartonella tamiae Th307]
MSNTSSHISVVAKRYAGALFDLAHEAKCVDDVEKELSSCLSLIESNSDLKRFIFSPVFSTKEQVNAVSALCEKFGLKGKGAAALVRNFLKVVAANRRLFDLPGIFDAFYQLAALSRGEISAEVTSARALTAAQEKELKATLKNVAGKDVRLNMIVDSKILGGLIIRLGSRQIDTSLATKLSSLKLALKEVG